MEDNAENQSSSGKRPVNTPDTSIHHVLGVVGIAFFWVWFFISMFGNTYLLPYSPLLMVEPFFRFLSLLVMTIVFVVLLLIAPPPPSEEHHASTCTHEHGDVHLDANPLPHESLS